MLFVEMLYVYVKQSPIIDRRSEFAVDAKQKRIGFPA